MVNFIFFIIQGCGLYDKVWELVLIPHDSITYTLPHQKSISHSFFHFSDTISRQAAASACQLIADHTPRDFCVRKTMWIICLSTCRCGQAASRVGSSSSGSNSVVDDVTTGGSDRNVLTANYAKKQKKNTRFFVWCAKYDVPGDLE